jgi:hypothetical protein
LVTDIERPSREAAKEGIKKVSKRPPRGRTKVKSGTSQSRAPRGNSKEE